MWPWNKLVKFIWIQKRCAWNVYCDYNDITNVMVGFIMLELLTQMWKHCKMQSAFTVENAVKYLLPTGFQGSVCQCTFGGMGCAVMFGRCIIGQWYSHWHSSVIWNIEYSRHNVFIYVFMCGFGAISKSPGAVHCSNRQSWLFICAYEKVFLQNLPTRCRLQSRWSATPKISHVCNHMNLCLCYMHLILCVCFTMETHIFMCFFFYPFVRNRTATACCIWN